MFPAAKITVYELTEAPLRMPQQVKPGEAILLPSHPALLTPRLNSRKMIYIPWRQTWLGIAPLGFEKIQITGLISRSAEPTKGIFSVQADVLLDKQTAPRSLRIPAQVWTSLEDESVRLRKKKDLDDFHGAISAPWPELNSNCWQAPLKSQQTSAFGTHRLLPNGRSYYHSGQDLRALTGTPIRSVGPGLVTFSGEMLVAGTNVIVSHGGGIFSRYLHLSEVRVQKGYQVKAGQIIGLSGSTGRVEAPHLHWEMIVRGTHADPSGFLQTWAQLCDPESVES